MDSSGVAYFQTNSWLSAVALRCYLLDSEAKERFQLGGSACCWCRPTGDGNGVQSVTSVFPRVETAPRWQKSIMLSPSSFIVSGFKYDLCPFLLEWSSRAFTFFTRGILNQQPSASRSCIPQVWSAIHGQKLGIEWASNRCEAPQS